MDTQNKIPNWLKTKGYIHISPSLRIPQNWKIYKRKIENPDFIARYAFYPLIHATINERKYKKVDFTKHKNSRERAHNFKHIDGKFEATSKNRPLHYASHFDALIYSYYANVLGEKYEEVLKESKELNESVNAYRKIKVSENSDRGKSTIDFAKEVFDEIKKRGKFEEVGVLTFDIKSFFSSLDHKILEEKWLLLIGKDEMPKADKNVLKSCTQFRYILKNDLRINKNKFGRKAGFDEKKLSRIRREKGFKCFFESNEDFRNHIKSGQLRVYKNPFYSNKINVGIPQGLPISAILANLYLLDFDKNIIKNIVKNEGGFYRRYSDDIIVICKKENIDKTKVFVETLIKDSNLEISAHKTEKFLFRNVQFNSSTATRLTSFKLSGSEQKKDFPLIYLGFEFRGHNVVIKSTNVSKFYRRLISIVKRRAKRAKNNNNPHISRAIFKNQVSKLYRRPLRDLDNDNSDMKQVFRNRTFLVKNERGEFNLVSRKIEFEKQSNYFSYLKRCVKAFDTTKFFHQHRKKKHILNNTIQRYL